MAAPAAGPAPGPAPAPAVPGLPGAAAADKGAKKKDAVMQFQIEADTEVQWRSLLRREGLIVIDVYASWCGPCTSMVSILKRIKVEMNDERLWYGLACSDKIDDLLMFKDQSEPTWLFVGGGKPVKVFRGSHAPNLIHTIKSEFEHEVECIEGKSRRNFISIDDEVSRKLKAEAEASRLANLVVEEDNAAAQTLNELRRESSVSLMGSLEPYTVAIIQPFIIAAGSAQEIKDYLHGDFKIIQEMVADMTEDHARSLYRIPKEILDPVQDFGYSTEDIGNEDMMASASAIDADDEEIQEQPKKDVKKKIKTIQIPLPDGLVGETIFLLLEHEEIKRLADEGAKPSGTLLNTADDYIRIKVGPVSYKDALEHAPSCLHAVYGKEDCTGVWCPRKYDDKRYVMLNFFPKFIHQVLAVTPTETTKYLCAVFPGVTGAQAIDENADISNNTNDIIAQGKVKIPMELAEEMLASWNVGGGDLMTKKAALTSSEVYAISINWKNSALIEALNSMSPIHISFDKPNGRKETALLFPHLNLTVEELTTPEEILEKFLARSRPRFESVMALDDVDGLPIMEPGLGSEDEEEMMAAEEEHEASEAPPPPPPPEGEAGEDEEEAEEAEVEVEEEEEMPPKASLEEEDSDEG